MVLITLIIIWDVDENYKERGFLWHWRLDPHKTIDVLFFHVMQPTYVMP